jgi:hypothetical protein
MIQNPNSIALFVLVASAFIIGAFCGSALVFAYFKFFKSDKQIEPQPADEGIMNECFDINKISIF